MEYEVTQAFMAGWQANARRHSEITGESVQEFGTLEEFKQHLAELETELIAEAIKRLFPA